MVIFLSLLRYESFQRLPNKRIRRRAARWMIRRTVCIGLDEAGVDSQTLRRGGLGSLDVMQSATIVFTARSVSHEVNAKVVWLVGVFAAIPILTRTECTNGAS